MRGVATRTTGRGYTIHFSSLPRRRRNPRRRWVGPGCGSVRGYGVRGYGVRTTQCTSRGCSACGAIGGGGGPGQAVRASDARCWRRPRGRRRRNGPPGCSLGGSSAPWRGTGRRVEPTVDGVNECDGTRVDSCETRWRARVTSRALRGRGTRSAKGVPLCCRTVPHGPRKRESELCRTDPIRAMTPFVPRRANPGRSHDRPNWSRRRFN